MTPDKPLTPEYLAECKALADAASKGPWKAVDLDGQQDTWVVVSEKDFSSIDWDDRPDFSVATSPFNSGGHFCQIRCKENMAFVAASRTMAPALLAEIDRLRAALGIIKSMTYTQPAATDFEMEDIRDFARQALGETTPPQDSGPRDGC